MTDDTIRRNSMRNPFPKIGKVIKYDLKHSSKRLLPLYGVLLILGLLVGLFISPDRLQQYDSSYYTMGYRDFITVSYEPKNTDYLKKDWKA